MIGIRRPFYHTTTTHYQGTMIREKTPKLYVPNARPMREPGTNYLTYITANGPRTIKA